MISPFGEPFDEYYREIYRPGIEAAGLDPIRADEIFRPGVFMREVVEQIASCAVALAELTGRNANVFYELGLAHALGKPVVLLAQQPEDVPADLRAIRWIRYDRVRPHWSSKLQTDIAEALQAALAGEPSPVIDGPSDRDLARRLAAVSGTQKHILDHLRSAPSPIALPLLSQRFKKPASEMYYRLETLRLSGMVTATQETTEPAYELTRELLSVWPSRTSYLGPSSG